jgi:hypothetical protein
MTHPVITILDKIEVCRIFSGVTAAEVQLLFVNREGRKGTRVITARFGALPSITHIESNCYGFPTDVPRRTAGSGTGIAGPTRKRRSFWATLSEAPETYLRIVPENA